MRIGRESERIEGRKSGGVMWRRGDYSYYTASIIINHVTCMLFVVVVVVVVVYCCCCCCCWPKLTISLIEENSS